MKLDLKSFLIGALSVVCIVLLTGAKQTNYDYPQAGRYVVMEQTVNKLDLLDTGTGKVYRELVMIGDLQSFIHYSETDMVGHGKEGKIQTLNN